MAGRAPTIVKDERKYRKSKETLKNIKEATPIYQSQNFVPPATLNGKELEVWKWLVGVFRETTNCMVSDADVQIMEMYCRAKVATDEADQELKRDNRYYVIVPLGRDKDGHPRTTAKPNPNYKKRTDNAMLCLKFIDQLGLSPLARARAGIKGANAKAEEDIFKKLLERSDD